jgi:tRNA-Thr(GGU) m(6)t(6)A37 methyltransferase TsaA
MSMSPVTFNPIGVLKSDQVEPYQASRQPDGLSSEAVITLNSGQNYEQALTDLAGCSHLWIIYAFHKNENWKPMVQTPRSNRKIGVFATRAPYRPNPIGLSLVKLESVDGLNIHIGPNDILNDTPILDIKPFHPESDVAEDVHIEWLESSLTPKMGLSFSPLASEQIDYLENQNGDMTQLRSFIYRQLEYDPTNAEKKRVEFVQSYWVLAYRTWRIDFIVQDTTVAILGIRTGYSEEDLAAGEDKYLDKDLHRKFIKNFA